MLKQKQREKLPASGVLQTKDTQLSCLLNVCLYTVIHFMTFVFLSEICVISELEDLSASVDVQDVYTKIKCKVVSFNIDHYRCR